LKEPFSFQRESVIKHQKKKMLERDFSVQERRNLRKKGGEVSYREKKGPIDQMSFGGKKGPPTDRNKVGGGVSQGGGKGEGEAPRPGGNEHRGLVLKKNTQGGGGGKENLTPSRSTVLFGNNGKKKGAKEIVEDDPVGQKERGAPIGKAPGGGKHVTALRGVGEGGEKGEKGPV